MPRCGAVELDEPLATGVPFDVIREQLMRGRSLFTDACVTPTRHLFLSKNFFIDTFALFNTTAR